MLPEHDFEYYNNVLKPKYRHPPIVFIILDDLIGDNKVFKQQSLINNKLIKHSHLGVNFVFTSQNPKSIPNKIRNNIDVYILQVCKHRLYPVRAGSRSIFPGRSLGKLRANKLNKVVEN